MKKLSILVSLLLVAVVVFAACGAPVAETPSVSADAGSSTAAESVAPSSDGGGAASGDAITIAMLPKFKGENYFDACKVGAEEAVQELKDAGKDVTLLYDGPPQDNATNQKQVDILEGWIAQGVNVIIISPNDPTAIAPTLQKAQAAGIKVVTFDADAQEDARDLFVNQSSADGIALGMVSAAADKMTAKGYGKDKPANVAIVSSAKTDANQNSWIDAIKALLATDEYSWMKLNNEETDIYYPGPDETETQKQAGTLISRMGEGDDKIQIAIGITSMATPALGAQYESAAKKPDVANVTMTGLATPNALKTYILDETNPLETGVLWNCMDLGYLAVMAGYQLGTGEITADATTMTTERLGERTIENKQILLGDALVFGASNVEQFDY